MCVMNIMLEAISKDFADQRPGIKRIGATFDMGIILKFCPTAWIGETDRESKAGLKIFSMLLSVCLLAVVLVAGWW